MSTRQETVMNLNRAGGFILSIYLGLAPVYWLPGISVSLLETLKFVLIGTGIILILTNALMSRRSGLPRGLLGVAGFILLVLSASFAFLQAEPPMALRGFFDIALGFIMLWTFYNFTRAGGNVLYVFTASAFIISFFSLLTVSNWFYNAPSWISPFREQPLWLGGFGGARTGWSNGISFYFTIMLLYAVYQLKYAGKPLGVFCLGLAVVAIFGSQLFSGGRAGIVSSLIIMPIVFYWLLSRKKLLYLFIMGLLALGIFMSADFLREQLRVSEVGVNATTIEQLDELSAGRIEGYLIALDLLLDRPLTGYGFGTINLRDFGLGYTEIHNVWLKTAVEGGILLPMMFLLLVSYMLTLSWRQLNKVKLLKKPAYQHTLPFLTILILVNGFFISMLEGHVLLGTFQNSAMWWAVAGVVGALPGGALLPRDLPFQPQPYHTWPFAGERSK